MQQVAHHRMRGFMIIIKISVLAWCFLLSVESFAQAPSTFSQDFRLWTPAFLTVKRPSSVFAYM